MGSSVQGNWSLKWYLLHCLCLCILTYFCTVCKCKIKHTAHAYATYLYRNEFGRAKNAICRVCLCHYLSISFVFMIIGKLPCPTGPLRLPVKMCVCTHANLISSFLHFPIFFEKHLFPLSKKMKMCVNAYYFAATSIISEVSNVVLKHYWAQSILTSRHNHLSSFEYFPTYLLIFYGEESI